MVICLSSQYEGEAFQNSYAVNPTTGEEIKLSFDLNLSRDELRAACNSKDDYSPQLLKACNAMMAIGYPASLERERVHVFQRAVATAMDQLGVGADDSLSSEQLAEFRRIVTKEITPCLLHQMPMLSTGSH
jgi:hypothetical protein